MKINLITKKQHETIFNIFNTYSIFTLQNKGYEYINKSKFSQDEWSKINEIENILKDAICGFSSFSNFRLDKNNDLQIRLQYNYGAEVNESRFIGVGYILLDELLNGFRE